MNKLNNRVISSNWYMAWYQNLNVLMNSSSRETFTAIAEVILKTGGVVFGVACDENTWGISKMGLA